MDSFLNTYRFLCREEKRLCVSGLNGEQGVCRPVVFLLVPHKDVASKCNRGKPQPVWAILEVREKKKEQREINKSIDEFG